MRDVLREVSREEMVTAVEWLRSISEPWSDEYGYLDGIYQKDAIGILAYIDLLERRIRELGGEP